MTDSTVTGNTRDSHEDRDDFARANDPLLELSRIFGFEQPATPHSGPTTPHSGDEPVASYTEDTGPQYYADEQSAQPYEQQQQFAGYQSEADVELSLERELLSDFDEQFAADFAEFPNIGCCSTDSRLAGSLQEVDPWPRCSPPISRSSTCAATP